MNGQWRSDRPRPFPRFAGSIGYEREVLMARSPSKPFHCSVISENVSIALRRRSSFRGDGKLYVQCSEVDCQWIDANEPPCPLTLDLFADEIRAREAQRAE